MDKRYQVFVSSTYADLKEERQSVIQTLMVMDCIPAGMELFPAADEEQWAFIQRVIDDCDYYLLIIGGRYGSITSDGISYTEKEYDYAVERGIKVIALIHEKPDDRPVSKSETNPELRLRLEVFRKKVSSNRLVRFWERTEDLPGLVASSLSKTIKLFPAIGWVRANTVANEELLLQLNELRKENETLRKSLQEFQVEQNAMVANLAGLDERFTIHGTSWSQEERRRWETTLTWGEIFAMFAPYLLQHPNDGLANSELADRLVDRMQFKGRTHRITDEDFETVLLQFRTLSLISANYSQTTTGGMALFLSLTSQGERLMIQMRTVPAAQ